MVATIQTICESLEKATVSEIVLYDYVRYGFENKLDVVCVRCTCKVSVDFFDVAAFVQILKFLLYIGAGILACVSACRK